MLHNHKNRQALEGASARLIETINRTKEYQLPLTIAFIDFEKAQQLFNGTKYDRNNKKRPQKNKVNTTKEPR